MVTIGSQKAGWESEAFDRGDNVSQPVTSPTAPSVT